MYDNITTYIQDTCMITLLHIHTGSCMINYYTYIQDTCMITLLHIHTGYMYDKLLHIHTGYMDLYG